jgi:hypothetical protein
MPKRRKLSSKGQPAQEEKKRDADQKRLQKRRQHESQEDTNQRRKQDTRLGVRFPSDWLQIFVRPAKISMQSAVV